MAQHHYPPSIEHRFLVFLEESFKLRAIGLGPLEQGMVRCSRENNQALQLFEGMEQQRFLAVLSEVAALGQSTRRS